MIEFFILKNIVCKNSLFCTDTKENDEKSLIAIHFSLLLG